MLNKKNYLISALIINTYLLLGCGNEEPHSPNGSSSSGLLISKKEIVNAINSGGPKIVYDSITFEKDQHSRNRTVSSTPDLIFATKKSELFQTERYGSYSYEIPVSDANYDIRLFFNELFHTVEGGRIFSVTVETKTPLTQRMFGPSSSGAIKLEDKDLKYGDTAGIAAFQYQYGLVGVHRSADQSYIAMINNNGKNHNKKDRITWDFNHRHSRLN